MGSAKNLAKRLINYNSEKSIAFKLRKKRAERIIQLIEKTYNEKGKVDILDIGGTKTYWNIIPMDFLKKHKVHITLINIPSSGETEESTELFTSKFGDGCDLNEFENKTFDIAHSNSVIEHVGSWENMIKFSKEIERLADKVYLQTPNYWFPIEPHYVAPVIHWLPKRIRIKLVQNFTIGWIDKTPNYQEAKGVVEGLNLLSRKDLVKLFPDYNYYREKMGMLTKSFVLIGRAA